MIKMRRLVDAASAAVSVCEFPKEKVKSLIDSGIWAVVDKADAPKDEKPSVAIKHAEEKSVEQPNEEESKKKGRGRPRKGE